jgi:hypothetical protein
VTPNLSRTTSTSVAFSWVPPINDGGSAVTSYYIKWDQGIGEWVI